MPSDSVCFVWGLSRCGLLGPSVKRERDLQTAIGYFLANQRASLRTEQRASLRTEQRASLRTELKLLFPMQVHAVHSRKLTLSQAHPQPPPCAMHAWIAFFPKCRQFRRALRGWTCHDCHRPTSSRSFWMLAFEDKRCQQIESPTPD